MICGFAQTVKGQFDVFYLYLASAAAQGGSGFRPNHAREALSVLSLHYLPRGSSAVTVKEEINQPINRTSSHFDDMLE